jgi:hypothetical protein
MDIRFPIGFMFSLTGLIITLWGLTSGPEIYIKSLGININLWTGMAMLVFGLAFLFLGLHAHWKNKDRNSPQSR